MPRNDDVETCVLAAWKMVRAHDADLLHLGANERAIAHRLAIYLEPHFPGWHVDCEYNRHGTGTEPKRLNPVVTGAGVRPTRTTDRVVPDIVVHERMTDARNLLAIEMKPAYGDGDAEDRWKLEQLTHPLGGYQYDWGLHLVLPATLTDAPVFTWFKDGRRVN